MREKNYFFRLSRTGMPLLAHFAAHPEFLQPDVRRNEILRLLEAGSRTSRSAAPASLGHRRCPTIPAACLRLVRRAHQLHLGRRATGPTMRCSRAGGLPTCT
jgi:hypothetical protein